jgi:hypothetical protein
MVALTWNYERDECWGVSGEPLLNASLQNDELLLQVRNSRQCAMEVVIVSVKGDDFDGDSEGPAFKFAFDDGGLRPLQARVQSSGHLAFVTDPRAFVAELNCSNRLRLHARRASGGVWRQLDASFDDLQLQRLIEPGRGIGLLYGAPERHAPVPVTARGRARQTLAAPAAAAPAPPAASAASELVAAVAPLAAFAIGAKLGHKMFGPSNRD